MTKTKMVKEHINGIVKYISKVVNVPMWEMLLAGARYTILVGARMTGKTYTVAQFITQHIIKNPNDCALVLRENFSNLRRSIYQDFLEIAETFHIKDVVDDKKVPLEITFPKGNAVMFSGVDNPDRIKGIKKAGKKIRYTVYEEAQNMDDILKIIKADHSAFRGQKNRHTIIIMNSDVPNFIFDDFYDKVGFYPDISTLETKGYMIKRFVDKERHIDWMLSYWSVFSNKFLHKEDLEEFYYLKENNYPRYLIDALGIWGNMGGSIYGSSANKIKYVDELPDDLIDHTFGVDYGEVNSATVCCHIAYSPKYEKLYLLDAYYWKNSTQYRKNSMEFRDDIVNFIGGAQKEHSIDDFMVIVDSAAQVFKDNILIELELLGYKNFMCIPTLNKNAVPGKFDVMERISLMTTLMAEGRFHIYKKGNYEPFINEIKRAVYDENSVKIKRKDAWNDFLDALEYAIMNRYKTLINIFKQNKMKKLYNNNTRR